MRVLAVIGVLLAAGCGSGASAPDGSSGRISYSQMAQRLHAQTCWHGGTGGYYACEWRDGVEEAGNTYAELEASYRNDEAIASSPSFNAQARREKELCGIKPTSQATPAGLACMTIADSTPAARFPAIKRKCGRPTAKVAWLTCATKVGNA